MLPAVFGKSSHMHKQSPKKLGPILIYDKNVDKDLTIYLYDDETVTVGASSVHISKSDLLQIMLKLRELKNNG
jgi:hypothetical protein